MSVSAVLGFVVASASAMTVSSTGESGCSLRAAIQAVADDNSGTSCGDVVSGGPTPINLAANTYTPTNGQILVPAGVNVEINGDNVNNPLTTVIDGTGGVAGRVFEIANGATVKMSGLTVTGGHAFDGGPATSLYSAYSGQNGGGIFNQGSLTLDHVVVTANHAGDGGDGWNGGIEESGGGAGYGGGGGGIYNADNASLAINDSVISDNVAGQGGDGGDGGAGVNASGHNASGRSGGDGGPGGSGGGIFNSNFGSLSIDRTTIKHNFSGRGGNGGAGHQGAGGNGTFTSGGNGGSGGDGGDNGKAYCSGCSNTFTDEARGGGGVYNLGSATLTNSTVSGNGTGAGGLGGPSGPGGQDTSGTFRASGSAGNGGGGGRGGGLLNGSWHQGEMTLINLTITGNQTGDGGTGGGGPLGASSLGGGPGGFGGDGGGIWAQGSHDHSTTVTHLTIAKNFLGSKGLGGGGQDAGIPGGRGIGAGIAAGGRYNPGGSGIYMKRTLVVSNGNSALGDKNCIQYQNIDNYHEFSDQGNNLSYPNDGSLCFGLTNVDPQLGLLGDHGGPTETMVPAPGSAAIGGVPLASCDIPNDQRGEPRPGADGASCDIGAVETGAGDALTPTTIQVVSSAQPSKAGQQVTFTATVSPPPSSGTVAFKDGGATISGCAAAALKQGGKFTCPVTYGSPGTHSIVASYSGNTLFGASTSAALTQTVNPGSVTQPKTAKISKVKVTGPSSTRKGGSPTFKARITNSGNAAASGVTLKVTGGGANLSKKVGGVPAGSSKVVKIRVKLKKVGQKTLAFKASSANAGGASATKSVTVRPRRRHHPRHH
ncbi:MAG: Ig-like domain repeat protein [Solirubrobacterales bacterium]|nr:Ig-like domain repeat protein [Solirubrobacterales bacterium]